MERFDYHVEMNVLYKVNQDFPMASLDEKILKETDKFVAELEKTIKWAVLDEVERTKRLRMAVDSRIQEQIEGNGKLKLSDLGQLSRNLFEREQLLVGRPTSITQSYKGMSDEELLKQLKELDVSNLTSGREKEALGQTSALGIEPPQTGGEDSLLETPSSTGEVRSV